MRGCAATASKAIPACSGRFRCAQPSTPRMWAAAHLIHAHGRPGHPVLAPPRRPRLPSGRNSTSSAHAWHRPSRAGGPPSRVDRPFFGTFHGAAETRHVPLRPSTDHFPNETAQVRGLLRDGLEREAMSHVMRCYRDALLAYVRGSSFLRGFEEAGLGTADEDLVQEFLLERVGREGFLQQWLASGARFRHWLIASFRNLLLDRRRSDLRRAARRASVPEGFDPAADTQDAEAAFDAQVARAIVAQAMRLVQDHARERGLNDHWEVFRRHRLEGRTRREIASEMSELDRDVACVVRTVEGWLREAIRTLVRWPGASEAEVEQEIHRLMEAIRT